MKPIALLIALVSFGQAISQTVVVPPPHGMPPLVSKKKWKVGAANSGLPVQPTVRSTRESYPELKPWPMDRVNHKWIIPADLPPGEEAQAYRDLGEAGTDAPDWLYRARGIDDTGVTPPDTALAVGPKYIVQATNTTFTISDKSGVVSYQNTINSFIGDGVSTITNPRVIYDPWSARYVQLWCSRAPGSNVAYLLLLVSDDSDPNGAWYVYNFVATTGDLILAYPDDYDLGYGPTGIYASGNQYSIFGSIFQNAALRTWNKTELYSGTAGQMRTDELFTNPDGTPVFCPRTASLQATVGGLDAVFINSRPGGGNKLTTWKLTDSFGAHILTPTDTTVAVYDLPQTAVQPSGALLDTQDCRLNNCVVTAFDATTLRLFTGSQESFQWTDDIIPRAVAHFYVLNPIANSVVWEGIFGLPNFHYWLSNAAADFRDSAMWAFSRCGINAPAYAEIRYVDWNAGLFSNASKQLKNGEADYSGFRWGDYLASCIDWTDYGGLGTAQKIWVGGEVASNITNLWMTWYGAAVANTTPGIMLVGTPNGAFEGPPGGPFNFPEVSYTLSNSGNVAYAFTVTGLPAWVNYNTTYDEVLPGQNRNVTLTLNSVANELPIGNHNATITFTNMFGGQVITRPLSLKVKGNIFPTSSIVFSGFEFSGSVDDLRASDDRYFTFFNDVSNLESQVAFIGVSSVANAARLVITVEASVARSGLSQSILLYNFATNQMVEFVGTVGTTADSVRTITMTTNINQYIAPVSKQMVVILDWLPINDEDPAQDGWTHNVDFLSWNITP